MGLFGTEGEFGQRTLLTPEQMQLESQLQGANRGGTFAPAADYFRGILSNESQDFEDFARPELRRFSQETMPSLSEQFAGMGAGGLSSSGFRNAAIQAGTDLNERLASMRAQLRQNAAQGLMNIGQIGMQPTSENYYIPGQEGFVPGLLKTAGNVVGSFLGGITGNPFASSGPPSGNPFVSQAGRSNDLYQQSSSVMR